MFEPKRYILDSSALLRHPEILARGRSRRLVLPEAVMHELSVRGQNDTAFGLKNLINKASAHGLKIVRTPSTVKNELLPSDVNVRGISNADVDLVRIAIDYFERFGRETVCVVTLDKQLSELLKSRNIDSITPQEFLVGVKTDTFDLDLQSTATEILSTQKRNLIINIIVGLSSSIIGAFLYSNLQVIIRSISVWGTLLAAPIIGVILYWVRQRFRTAYAIIEFSVGMIMTYRVLFPNFDYTALHFTEGIQLLGGLYVMVRGLDNLSKGLEHTRFEPYWQRLFNRA